MASKRAAANAGTTTAKAFIAWLDTAPELSHLGWYERFRNIIELWFCAATRNEPAYLKQVAVVGEPALRDACRHFGGMWSAMHADPQDYLGEAYQAYSAHDRRSLAQYFTPDAVAQCMAAMTAPDLLRRELARPKGCSVLEPTVGTGVMLLHMLCKVREQHGAWGTNRLCMTGVDKDELCVKMAALQLWAWAPYRCARVTLLCGDSLGDPANLRVVFDAGRGVPPAREQARKLRKVVMQ